jgi:hypothetical protein
MIIPYDAKTSNMRLIYQGRTFDIHTQQHPDDATWQATISEILSEHIRVEWLRASALEETTAGCFARAVWDIYLYLNDQEPTLGVEWDGDIWAGEAAP